MWGGVHGFIQTLGFQKREAESTAGQVSARIPISAPNE
jgi:hypothetical protein